MSKTLHFAKSTVQLQSYGGEPIDRAAICRLIGTGESQTMGAGIAYFDGAEIEWAVLYDELIVVLEGEFHLTVPDQKIIARPGDVIWIPEKTPLIYAGNKAKVFYALYPVDWAQK
ncbi:MULTISPECIES: cupin domain-containing protein [Pseudomonas]|uniref:cupin domain-containing protein n=1 Tax=Pseudomonas TaxID=286 RepID=UPI00069FB4C3|nr:MULTISPECIES: cupin domain-containing protein [Pseudomonas]